MIAHGNAPDLSILLPLKLEVIRRKSVFQHFPDIGWLKPEHVNFVFMTFESLHRNVDTFLDWNIAIIIIVRPHPSTQQYNFPVYMYSAVWGDRRCIVRYLSNVQAQNAATDLLCALPGGTCCSLGGRILTLRDAVAFLVCDL